MSVLIDWITQIIVFILLAIIVELFVPTTKIAKYVRLVIGLIFLLIFLKPIFYIFQLDMEQLVSEQLFDTDHAIEKDSIDNLMTRQNEQLQAKNDEYILAEITEHLQEQSADSLAEHFVKINKIDYAFADESHNIHALEQLIVYIVPLDESTDDKAVVIDEVIIDLKQPTNQTDEKQLSDIKRTLIDIWHLNDEEIIVKWGN